MSSKKIAALLIAAVLGAVLLAACGGASEQTDPAAEPTTPAVPTTPPDPLAGWIEYSAPDGSFSVRLPKEPEIEEQTVPSDAGDIQVVMYLVDSGDRALLLGHNEFPDAIAEMIAGGDQAFIQTLLDGGRDGAVANVSGTLRSESQITVDGMPGREFTFTVNSDASPTGAAIEGTARILVAGNRLYQMLSLANVSETEPELVQAFFETFKLAGTQ
jgi:hypothetical protein